MGPEDLPRGFAEIPGGRGHYLQWRLEFNLPGAAEMMEQEYRDGFPTLLFTPKDGCIYDVGLEYYGEFICSLETAARFLKDGMTLNGIPGKVEVALRSMNGVQMRWRAISPT